MKNAVCVAIVPSSFLRKINIIHNMPKPADKTTIQFLKKLGAVK